MVRPLGFMYRLQHSDPQARSDREPAVFVPDIESILLDLADRWLVTQSRKKEVSRALHNIGQIVL